MPPKKRVLAVVKIQLEAGGATPRPGGHRLGPHGVQTMEFCKQYNAATRASEARSFRSTSRSTRTARSASSSRPRPPGAAAPGRRAGQGSATTGREQVGTITDSQLAEIAKVKLKDLNTTDLEAAKKQVAGTARSMGIKVAG